MRRFLALAALLPACVVPYAGPGDPYGQPPPPSAAPGPAYAPPPAYPPPPPQAYPAPPPPQRRLTRDEAVRAAWGYAAQRGLQPSRVHEAEHDEGRWKVELDLAQGGKARVVVDAWSGAELRFQVKGGRHRERHDEDHDD